MAEQSLSLEYTPAWVAALVCSIIVLLSVCAERGLHQLGKWLKHHDQKALYHALQRLKEELMILGFISFLLAVLQGRISHICIPSHFNNSMLPCKERRASSVGQHISHQTSPTNFHNNLAAAAETEHCASKGKVPLLSEEAVHELHIFVFILALVHLFFCASTMFLGGIKVQHWRHWEHEIRRQISITDDPPIVHHPHHSVFKLRVGKFWRKAAVVGWLIAFFKQFYGSVTKHDYVSLRYGFIQKHCSTLPKFDFHGYMLRTLEVDFRKIVSISSYLWFFLVVSLLLDVNGWHTYFWLAFLPLFLLLLVGAKLEHIITRLAKEVDEGKHVHPSDEHFWLGRPSIVLYIIHFILFENSFEIAFFFWILWTHGFNSCVMDKKKYIIPRLLVGVIVQVLCSYSTFPLYALVTQMGTDFKESMFKDYMLIQIKRWSDDAKSTRSQGSTRATEPAAGNNTQITGQRMVMDTGIGASTVEIIVPDKNEMPLPSALS